MNCSHEAVDAVGVPSGYGKSTLLRCIDGLEPITEGTIEIDGKVINDVSPANRGIAMMFKSYALCPHMTVFNNMAYSLKLQRVPRAEIRQYVEASARKLQLSGGQRQRITIGQAIVRDPKVFLFDEPLSDLDAAPRVQMRMELM